MADLDFSQVEQDVLDDLEHQLEEVRSLAESYAHKIMPHRSGRLCEIKKVDGQIYIVMTAYGAHIDEFGSVYQPPNAPLRRAMDALGLKFILEPKS